MRYGPLLYSFVAAGILAAGTKTVEPRSAEAAVHLRLKRSEPAKDSTMHKAPTAVRLWFTEPAEPAVARITLTGPDGKAVPVSAVRRQVNPADTALVADVTGSVNAGLYKVGWRVMSKDGHPVTGEFGFTVAPPSHSGH